VAPSANALKVKRARREERKRDIKKPIRKKTNLTTVI